MIASTAPTPAAPLSGGGVRLSKMHGAGNDFVLLDLRDGTTIDAALARRLASRHTGVGCDQILGVITSPRTDCVAGYRIWNADGSAAQQCGNGARCVAAWLRRADPALGARFVLDSPAGAIAVEALADGGYALDMGVPEFAPARIPLRVAAQADTYATVIDGEPLHFGAVSIGNPHALIVVENCAAAPVARLGAALQASALFPDGVNVGFAQVLAADRIRLRVVERGVGETLACGSGACAAVAILIRQGLLRRDRIQRDVIQHNVIQSDGSARAIAVELPGGTLQVSWPADTAPLRLAGPATFVFEGALV